MKYQFLFFIAFFLIVGCNSKSKTAEEIENIPVNFELVRFDKVFAEAKPTELNNLKSKYPLFFPEQYPDSIWIQKMTDSLQIALNSEVLKEFPSEDSITQDLIALFQHIQYYFPDFEVPQVYTTTSDVDYRTKVIANNNVLIIELDTYLGADHYFYEGISRYISKNMKPSQILPDVASIYAKKYIAPPSQRTFLDQLIYYGKELYLIELWLPDTKDYEKMGYNEEEMQWAIENEVEVWRYFIENELLYSTDPKLLPRFINPAPFSKFKLEIDNDSPGMIGRYIGWRIVQSYMEENPVSINQLMNKKAVDIFNDSKYKPKK